MIMQQSFNNIITTRKNFLELVESLSIDELNEIPEGFRNNVAWNFGHIIVSQQNLCYGRSGVQALIDQSFINKYQKGTKPESFIDAQEIETLKSYLFSLIEMQQRDLEAGRFTTYNAFTTHYGVKLTNVNEAISFVATHDALHYGFSKGLTNAVKAKKHFTDFQHIKISN